MGSRNFLVKGDRDVMQMHRSVTGNMGRSGGCRSQRPTDNTRADSGAESRDETADEVTQLKARLARLQAEQSERKVAP